MKGLTAKYIERFGLIEIIWFFNDLIFLVLQNIYFSPCVKFIGFLILCQKLFEKNLFLSHALMMATKSLFAMSPKKLLTVSCSESD